MDNSKQPSENGAVHFHADVSAQRIAKVYAESLLDAATRDNAVDEVLDEFRSLVGTVFTADAEVEKFLCSAAIGRERKAQVIRSAFEGRASPILVNFLLVLNDHDRLELLRTVLAALEGLNDERRKRVRVSVETAVPLPEDQREQLAAQLREMLHIEPVVETRVKPELLGGMVVRLRDWLYDASVRTQLETIRNQLTEASSYAIQSRRDRFSSDS